MSEKEEFYIAWWNVENLFDSIPWEQRARKVRNLDLMEDTGLKEDLENWDEPTLKKKLEQLADVITDMNSGKGPDILGVCEIENIDVLEDLKTAIEKVATTKGNVTMKKRVYQIVHHDSDDVRGIDVAFFYDENRLKPFTLNDMKDEGHISDAIIKKMEGKGAKLDTSWFSHEVIKRYPTRDIFQVNFYSKKNPKKPFMVIGNHWPSRLGGTYETEPYRIMAAETLSYYVYRIQDIWSDFGHIPIIVMGDFNDNPGSKSMLEYAQSVRFSRQALYGRKIKPKLHNLMWPLIDGKQMTFYYDGPHFYDQFLVSKGFVLKKGWFKVVEDSVAVFCPDKIRHAKGYRKPRRFGLKLDTPPGYSDHFPIVMKFKKS